MSLPTAIIKDEYNSHKSLLIIEKFEKYVNYVYPILQNIPRKDGIFKEESIKQLFHFVDLINEAAKSSQVSKLYLADACLASIRYKLRFMVFNKRRLITQHQQEVCLVHLSEVGGIINAWIKNPKKVK